MKSSRVFFYHFQRYLGCIPVCSLGTRLWMFRHRNTRQRMSYSPCLPGRPRRTRTCRPQGRSSQWSGQGRRTHRLKSIFHIFNNLKHFHSYWENLWFILIYIVWIGALLIILTHRCKDLDHQPRSRWFWRIRQRRGGSWCRPCCPGNSRKRRHQPPFHKCPHSCPEKRVNNNEHCAGL